MSTARERTDDDGALLHPELRAEHDPDAIIRDGRRLDHAEGASKPLRARPEPQPRGAKVHGNRPIDQAEAAARFIAAPEHEKMHDERLWDLRQKSAMLPGAPPAGGRTRYRFQSSLRDFMSQIDFLRHQGRSLGDHERAFWSS